MCDEFKELYNALFSKADRYVAIVKLLATKREGFTFEEICLWHLPHIKFGLGIAGIATESSLWRFTPSKDDPRGGAQIDLVIKRADKIIHLVEMKFSEGSYTISKDYERRLQERKQLFMSVTGITHGVVHTFITPSGITRGVHSAFIHSQLTANDLFADLPSR